MSGRSAVASKRSARPVSYTHLFARDGLSLGARYTDCGLMLYDIEAQDMHCGGSGCGLSLIHI